MEKLKINVIIIFLKLKIMMRVFKEYLNLHNELLLRNVKIFCYAVENIPWN